MVFSYTLVGHVKNKVVRNIISKKSFQAATKKDSEQKKYRCCSFFVQIWRNILCGSLAANMAVNDYMCFVCHALAITVR